MIDKVQIQVFKRGAEMWELISVTLLWDGTHAYEVVGRVVSEGGLYFVELPQWHDKGYEWQRQERGYFIPKGAIKAIEATVKAKATKYSEM